MFRIGFGYDAHRLVEGRALILGGIEVPHLRGLEGYSDADVLTHAVIDAIIGALGRGDIGQHFPDTDPAFKGADSIALLRETMTWVTGDGYKINNLDTVIVAQKPKLAPYTSKMRQRLAQVLDAAEGRINVKAKTTEGMGFCGMEEGIAAYAVVSLIRP